MTLDVVTAILMLDVFCYKSRHGLFLIHMLSLLIIKRD